MLYIDAKSQQNFLSLINATVSHELRNPVYSLISQITSQNLILSSFRKIISVLPENAVKDQMRQIYDQIKTCANKMLSATKFIDFFVHDILDYTLLIKKEKNFTKNLSIFDIRKAVNEILEILYD